MRPGCAPGPARRDVQNMDLDGGVLWAPARICVHNEGGASGAKVIRNA